MAASISRQFCRCFTTDSSSCRRLDTAVPGLIIYQNLLGIGQQKVLQEKVLELSRKILSNLESASIHPRRTFVSQYQNLEQKSHYHLVRLKDEEGTDIQGQHFLDYGDKGHRLTYFMGNSNIPKFVQNGLLGGIMQIPEISLLNTLSPLNWKLTFNTYAMAQDPSQLPGFDWHQDVAPNGDITMIYSIGTESEFNIRVPKKPTTIQKFPLLSNSLVLLSAEARWVYEHCVVPVKVSASQPLLDSQEESIRRISLVMGCARSDKVSDRSNYMHVKV